MAKTDLIFAVTRVSSHIIKSEARRVARARKEISARLPIGVETMCRPGTTTALSSLPLIAAKVGSSQYCDPSVVKTYTGSSSWQALRINSEFYH
jgi:hypothetical protein